MNKPAITLDNVTITFARRPAVHHISGQFTAGSLTAIVGPNGAGKSTLLKALAGLQALESGSIQFSSEQKSLAYLPQQAQFRKEDWDIRVDEFIALGQRLGLSPWKKPEQLKIQQSLREMQLEGLEKKLISELSGGQFQKVLWARIEQQNYDYYLLDEPLAPLDQISSEILLYKLEQLAAQGKCVIAVVHDLNLVEKYFSQCLLLARETIVWGDTALAAQNPLWKKISLNSAFDDRSLCELTEPLN